MNNKIEQDWIEFNETMLAHIREKGKKYNKYDTLSIMSDMFCIDSIIKYAIETKRSLEFDDTIDEPTVASIAHYAQVLISRLIEAETETLKGGDVTVESSKRSAFEAAKVKMNLNSRENHTDDSKE